MLLNFILPEDLPLSKAEPLKEVETPEKAQDQGDNFDEEVA